MNNIFNSFSISYGKKNDFKLEYIIVRIRWNWIDLNSDKTGVHCGESILYCLIFVCTFLQFSHGSAEECCKEKFASPLNTLQNIILLRPKAQISPLFHFFLGLQFIFIPIISADIGNMLYSILSATRLYVSADQSGSHYYSVRFRLLIHLFAMITKVRRKKWLKSANDLQLSLLIWLVFGTVKRTCLSSRGRNIKRTIRP